MKDRGFDIELQFVDMRYGVRDENTLEHETWLACAVELERCKRESEGTFFISLQAQKYGYRMAPKRIAREKYDAVFAAISQKMKLCEVPGLDVNATTFRDLLRDMTNGVKADVFGSMYELIGRDVCLKKPNFYGRFHFSGEPVPRSLSP